MITPLFSINQTAKQLHLRIRAPHSRPRDIQVDAHNHDFHFHCSPYLLRLRFSHKIELPDVDDSTAAYDITTGIATIALDKATPGTHFERLDMLSALLIQRPTTTDDPVEPARPSNPMIEVISSTEDSKPHAEDDAVSFSLPELNKQFEEVTDVSGVSVALRELSIGRPKYGFGDRYEAVFAVRAEDTSQILELPEPDTTPVWRRAALRREAEEAKFDADHYVADYMLEEDLEHILSYVPPRCNEVAPLTDAQVDTMLKLPRREYLSDVDKHAAANLAGILYASCYDVRATLGDRNVESAWTVSRLNATMSFLEHMTTAKGAIVAAYRRSLAYPLYRSCKVANAVLADLKQLFQNNDVNMLRSRLLRILLELREIFEDDRILRLHSDLFLTDYCIWIQKVDDIVLSQLRDAVLEVTVSRSELGWDLTSLERNAEAIANGEEPDGIEEPENIEEPAESPTSQLAPVRSETGRESDHSPRNAANSITISALSDFPKPGLEIVPISSRHLHQKEKDEDRACESSDYETDTSASSSDSDSE